MNKKPKDYSDSVIDEFYDGISEEEFELVEKKMLLAVRIDEGIKKKGWKKQDLAKTLKKNPSEITKWLSGTHNFTVETLWEIEKVLNIKLVNLYEKKPEEIIIRYTPIIVGQEIANVLSAREYYITRFDNVSGIVSESNNVKYAKKRKTVKEYSASVKIY